MLGFAVKRVAFEPLRSLLTVLVIAGVIAEILVLEGFLAGLYLQLRNSVLDRGGDLVVTQSGVSNFIATRSILPQTTRMDVESVEGVGTAHPLTGIAAIYEHDGRRTPIMILVHDDLGGPVEMIPAAHEVDQGIVIDQSLAVKYGLKPGDVMTISDFDFTIAAVSQNSAAFMTPFAFVTYDLLIDFYFDSDIGADIATFPLLSFLLVEVLPGQSVDEIRARIEASVPDADVYRPEELASRDENLGREMLGPILGLLLVVSFGIGALVVGLFMFVATRDRLHDLGTLRALGFRVRSLSLSIMLEALLLTALALPLGIVFAVGIAQFIESAAPVYRVMATEPGAILRTAMATVVFAVIGSLIPVRTVARIDPATVFRR